MTSKRSILIVLTLFVLCFVCASAFAASTTLNPKAIAPRWDKIFGGEDIPGTAAKPNYDGNTALGYFMTNPIQVGTTYLEYQSNGSMRHHIAIGIKAPGGACNRVHNVWTYLPGPSAASSTREVYYTSYTLNNAPDVPGGIQSVNGAGYCGVDTDTAGFAYPFFHNLTTANPDQGSYVAKDFGCGNGAFSYFHFPRPNCSGTNTGAQPDGALANYIWPDACADVDVAGATIVHAVGTESPPEAGTGTIQSLVYYRTNAGVTGPDPLTYNTCGKFIDSVYDISAVVRQDPTSNKVAIVYTKPRAYMADGGQVNNDIVYIESSNLGDAGTWGPVVNVTNYVDADIERAYTDVDAMYDRSGDLHIVWNAPRYDPATGGSYYASKLYHWAKSTNCKSLLINANNVDNCAPGAWNRMVAKMSIAECVVGADKRLYVTYTYFRGDAVGGASGDPGPTDCSAGGWANGEIYVQASSTNGATWGPPTNLTNTYSNGCAAGSCNSEHWSSQAMYVTDSLRIQYILDKDAGGIVQTEGTWTNNGVMNLFVPCFAMSTFQSLSATPSSLVYPKIHTTPGGNTSETITLTNSGNSPAGYSATVTNYTGPFSGWATITAGATGTVGAGCANSATLTVKATGPASPEGLGKADIVVTYPAKTTLTIPIECWNFSSWFLPQYATIRTATNKSVVQQVSRLGGEGSATWTYFADTSTYAFDASLIVGDGVNNLSYQIFEGGSGAGPTLTNQFGYLYALSPTTIDSVTFPSYSIASGIGCNRDSTVAFSVDWYAPKHVDSADFMVAHFDLYPGPKNPAATISNLAVAYAVDWDVKNDSAGNSRNSANFDEPRQMVYQRGEWTAPNTNRYGGISIQMDDNSAIDGGFAWTNTYSVYPVNGYENDTLWKGISNVVGYSAAGGTEDMNSVMVVSKATTIGPGKAGHLKFSVILATQYKVGGSLAGLQLAVDKAKKFICKHITPTSTYCAACTNCGDADNNGVINISDVVATIGFVFNSVPVPGDCNYQYGKADADGNKVVNISDVVALIGYVFNSTPVPHCFGM